jgi:hypothetical protein
MAYIEILEIFTMIPGRKVEDSLSKGIEQRPRSAFSEVSLFIGEKPVWVRTAL